MMKSNSPCVAAPYNRKYSHKDLWKKPACMTPHRPISEPAVGPHGPKWLLCPTPGYAPLPAEAVMSPSPPAQAVMSTRRQLPPTGSLSDGLTLARWLTISV